jgi:thiamine biosynthesis protein ThiS
MTRPHSPPAGGPPPDAASTPQPGTPATVLANGQKITALLPCSIDHFLRTQGLPPRSVVVELNGEAVAPSEFDKRILHAGDQMEIVRIVAGG